MVSEQEQEIKIPVTGLIHFFHLSFFLNIICSSEFSTTVIIGASLAAGVGLAVFIVACLCCAMYFKIRRKDLGYRTDQPQPEVTYSGDIDYRGGRMETFEDEEDVDRRMQINARIIANMTHFVSSLLQCNQLENIKSFRILLKNIFVGLFCSC